MRYFVCIGAALLSFAGAYAQEKAGKAPEALRQRVNSIDSFIGRFNFEEDNLGNMIPVPESTSATEAFVSERNKQILSLIDLQSKKLKKELIEEFLVSVNAPSQQVKLDFYDKQWFAEVQMDVLYKQKPQKMTLVLEIEETRPKTSRWMIRAVKADFLSVKTNGADSSKIIPPNSHSTDFISLPQNLADPKTIAFFAAPDQQPDLLSIFLYAVNNGEIEFKKTSHVTFHFLQIDNWIVRVEEVNRNLLNAGWLVAELIKADGMKKSQYAAQKLNIR